MGRGSGGLIAGMGRRSTLCDSDANTGKVGGVGSLAPAESSQTVTGFRSCRECLAHIQVAEHLDEQLIRQQAQQQLPRGPAPLFQSERRSSFPRIVPPPPHVLQRRRIPGRAGLLRTPEPNEALGKISRHLNDARRAPRHTRRAAPGRRALHIIFSALFHSTLSAGNAHRLAHRGTCGIGLLIHRTSAGRGDGSCPGSQRYLACVPLRFWPDFPRILPARYHVPARALNSSSRPFRWTY